MGADAVLRARPAGAPRARASGRARVDRAAQERAGDAAAAQGSRDASLSSDRTRTSGACCSANYNGIPSDPVTPLRGIREAVSRQHARAVRAGVRPRGRVSAARDHAVVRAANAGGRRGLEGAYFGSRTLEGTPVFTRADTTVEVDWHEGAPRQSMNPNDFGVRWTRHDTAASHRHVSARCHDDDARGDRARRQHHRSHGLSAARRRVPRPAPGAE